MIPRKPEDRSPKVVRITDYDMLEPDIEKKLQSRYNSGSTIKTIVHELTRPMVKGFSDETKEVSAMSGDLP